MKKIFISLLAAAALAAQFGCASAGEPQTGKRNLAVQIYSFRNFTVVDGLREVKKMGLDAVEASPAVRIGGEFKDQRMDLNMTPAAKAFLKKTLADMGMKFTGYGVIRTKNEAEVEAYCKLAKEFGINIILTEDPVSQFKYWDKIGKKYGITMVVHHHGSDSVTSIGSPRL